MLYERWLELVHSRSDRLALWDGQCGRSYTFRELAHAGERRPATAGPIQVARGGGADFIVSVLTAWRSGKVLMPLEQGQPESLGLQPLPAHIVHLKRTSATTGSARMIAFTAEQMAADCENVVASMGLDPSIPNVGAISPAHSYGFSNLILPLLLKGIPLLWAASALPESVRAAVDRVPGVALPAVPALWQAWHDAGILSDRIRIAISAGAPLPAPLEREVFDSAGVKIHNFYGSSECGGIAFDRTDLPREDAALAGTPMEGVDVGVNEDGCITVQSGAVGEGYWPDADDALARGVYQTGDLGEIIDGRVFLRGRASDRINVAGRKLRPEDVEHALSAHPAVKDCLVFGVPSEGLRNETVVACVACGAEVSPRQLTEFLQKHLPSWQVPREWWMLQSIEVNERGKRSRSEWRGRYLSQRGRSV